jgi:hypothetical protein
MHLVLDSTGLQLFGQGEWDAEKHGRARRQWRKLHLAVDADTGEIAADVLTEGHTDDATQAPACSGRSRAASLRRPRTAPMTAMPSNQVATRQHGLPPDVVIPPRASAVPSTDDPAARTQRDRHIRLIAEQGRMAWQRASGYGRRNLVEMVCMQTTSSA